MIRVQCSIFWIKFKYLTFVLAIVQSRIHFVRNVFTMGMRFCVPVKAFTWVCNQSPFNEDAFTFLDGILWIDNNNQMNVAITIASVHFDNQHKMKQSKHTETDIIRWKFSNDMYYNWLHKGDAVVSACEIEGCIDTHDDYVVVQRTTYTCSSASQWEWYSFAGCVMLSDECILRHFTYDNVCFQRVHHSVVFVNLHKRTIQNAHCHCYLLLVQYNIQRNIHCLNAKAISNYLGDSETNSLIWISG